MTRGLTSAVKTALASSPSFCHLVYMGILFHLFSVFLN